jgi:hypothetical protein
MALITGLFALVGRFAGRIVNSSLGWATILLFGKVSGRRQLVLSLIALGALAWIIVLLGILVPAIAVFLLAAVTLPSFVDPTWVRLAMLAAAVLIPVLIGIAAIVVTEPGRRPKGFGLVVGVLRGYPFTLLLAVTIALLAGVSIVRKLASMARRHEDAHVALIVKPGGYDEVLADLETVLDASGIDVTRVPAPAILSIPPRLLEAVAGPSLGELVPDRLMVLKAQGLEILVYPSDLAISGTKALVAKSRAVIAAKLTESPAYMTTTAEAERIEDDIRKLATGAGTGGGAAAGAGLGAGSAGAGASRRAELLARIEDLDGKLVGLTIDFDEWETLYRERLQVERDLLAQEVAAAGGVEEQRGSGRVGARALDVAVGAAGVVLMLVDVVLLVAARLRPRGLARGGRGRR